MRELEELATELLETAAERIRSTGWKTGSDGPPGGPNCVRGALMHAWCSEPLTNRSADAVQLGNAHSIAWRALCAEVQGSPVHWNDYNCTDGEQAADMLLHAAKRVANEEDQWNSSVK